ncbi:uncharacterized protein GGS22DRAFT_62917 [Annulohypoxylon maeteangense]|uniref:uncharacterized protein n=1 Tax=Annulohypoxylon maeteangense TaxID=1927788 RepID=UPI002008A15B|nr:uncharacterized protein GGS22DRAFT_62917 [Annulohypoxylon maeteangense]KAI0888767.1 hypothetical protein GGS22DRAFT_62917 [Annulohypoxylon maeteangense]
MALEVPAGTPDRGPGLVVMCALLIVLTSISAVTRVLSKVIVKQPWWWDDFFALISLPIQLTLFGIILTWRNIGLGLHADVVAAENPLYLIQGAKYLYIAIFFFDASISFPKLSAICFYARVFRSNNRHFRNHLWVVGSLVVGWLTASLISTIFQCSPIEKAWNSPLPGTCIHTFAWYLSTSALSVSIDLYILLLPVPMIWALKLSLRRRVYLLAAFFLAYSVIVLSIGRMISTIGLIPNLEADITWNLPAYLYWACIEGALSLISVSVPNMVGLVKALMGPRWPGTNPKSSNKHTDPESLNYNASAGVHASQSFGGDHDGFERLVSSTGSIASGINDHDGKGAAIALDRIHVKTQITVDRR